MPKSYITISGKTYVVEDWSLSEGYKISDHYIRCFIKSFDELMKTNQINISMLYKNAEFSLSSLRYGNCDGKGQILGFGRGAIEIGSLTSFNSDSLGDYSGELEDEDSDELEETGVCNGITGKTEHYEFMLKKDRSAEITHCNLEEKTIIVPKKLAGYLVKSISVVSFSDNVEVIKLPDSITEIGGSVFRGHVKLKQIILPPGLVKIGKEAFRDCGLKTINLPDSVEIVGAKAFYNNGSLESLSLGRGIKIIEDSVFESCDSLTSVTIPDSTIKIGPSVFKWCGSIKTVCISDSVEVIGSEAFQYNRELESLSLGKGVKVIEDSAFESCYSLTSVTIPESIEKIGANAFKNCFNLNEVSVPEHIYDDFLSNSLLYGINLNSTVHNIEIRKVKQLKSQQNEGSVDIEQIGGHGALGILNLAELKKYAETKELRGESGKQTDYEDKYEGDEKEKGENLDILISDELEDNSINIPNLENVKPTNKQYQVKNGSAIIKKGIKNIKDSAYIHNKSLTSVIIPDGVKKIGERSFAHCELLNTVCIADSVEVIGSEAFTCNGALKSLSLGKGIKTIGEGAFSWCPYLTTVTIPDSVTKIGANAFQGCSLDEVLVSEEKYDDFVKNLHHYGIGSNTEIRKAKSSESEQSNEGTDSEEISVHGKFENDRNIENKLMNYDLYKLIIGTLHICDLIQDSGGGFYKEPDITLSFMFKNDLVLYLGYLAYSDGKLTQDETTFINNHIDSDYTQTELEEYILTSRVISEKFKNDPPLTLMALVRHDNNFIDVNDRNIRERTASWRLLILYKKIAERFARFDTDSKKYIKRAMEYYYMMEKYRDDNLIKNDENEDDDDSNILTSDENEEYSRYIPILENQIASEKKDYCLRSGRIYISIMNDNIQTRIFAKTVKKYFLDLCQIVSVKSQDSYISPSWDIMFILDGEKKFEGSTTYNLVFYYLDQIEKAKNIIIDMSYQGDFVKTNAYGLSMFRYLANDDLSEKVVYRGYETIDDKSEMYIFENRKGSLKSGKIHLDKKIEVSKYKGDWVFANSFSYSVKFGRALSGTEEFELKSLIEDESARIELVLNNDIEYSLIKVDTNSASLSFTSAALIKHKKIVSIFEIVSSLHSSILRLTKLDDVDIFIKFIPYSLLYPDYSSAFEFSDKSIWNELNIYPDENGVLSLGIKSIEGEISNEKIIQLGEPGTLDILDSPELKKSAETNDLQDDSAKLPVCEEDKIKKVDADNKETSADCISLESKSYLGSLEVSKQVFDEIDDFAKRGEKIKAIKLVRDVTGLGLNEAKEAIDSYWSKNHYGNVNNTQNANEKSGACYVATAVYGSYDCPQVWTLRRYRDTVLAETWYGRAFIRTYYMISPCIVKWFGHSNWFNKMWRGKLDRIVSKLQTIGVESSPYSDKISY